MDKYDDKDDRSINTKMPDQAHKPHNQVYLFIPIYYKGTEATFPQFRNQLLGDGCWEVATDEIRHLYRYITDKMDATKPDECLYFHLKLTDEELERRGFGAGGTTYSIRPKDEYKFDDEIEFKILNVHLFGFRTMINIAAVQISFVDDDPLFIATSIYYLKKAKREQIRIGCLDTGNSLLDMVRELFDPAMLDDMSFFFYLNPGMERSNSMSLTYHAPEAELDKEMYFLKNGFREKGFEYTPEQHKPDELLVTSNDYIWGVTDENLACIITKSTKHIQNAFIKHFGEQYLFVYVLLLHRKYDLYRILTDIGVGEQRDLSSLKYYKELLYEYQTDYSYERITEVPQYHLLYKKVEKKMDLDALFADVMEPVSSLSQLRQEKSEEEQTRRSHEVENALGLLSALTVFSALIDSYSYIEAIIDDVQSISTAPPMTYIQLGFSFMIIATVVFVIEKIKRGR